MKAFKYFTILLVSTFVVAGCDGWVDDVEHQTGYVPAENVYASKASTEEALTGIYYYIREYEFDRTVTIGYKNYTLGFDFMGDDIVSNPSQWWVYEYQFNSSIRSATGYRSNFIWRMFYTIINDANGVIDGVQKSTTIPEAQKPALIAEAKAIRAFSYFNLIRVFQHTYWGNEAAPGLPIYDKVTTITTEGQPRKSVQEVYSFILSDLSDENINQIPVSLAKHRINRNVALGIRANVNLTMRNWAEAASDAELARQGYPLMDEATYTTSGFNNINTKEWMWGSPFRPDQSLLWASFFSHVDIQRPQAGYKNFFMNVEFVKLFSATDYRAMFEKPRVGANATWGQLTSAKFKDRQPDADGDYVNMRSSEMYLIEAEAKAQLNDPTAGDVLYELQLTRDPQAVKSGKTGQELVDEILVERRKELYGEIGVMYFDLMRYNLPLVRGGNHSAKLTVSAGSKYWLYQIPQREFTTNTAMDQVKDQNP